MNAMHAPKFPAYKFQILQAGQSELIGKVVDLINECYRGRGNWTNEADIVSGLRTNRQALLSELSTMDVILALPHGGSKDLDPPVLGCVKTGIVSSTVVGPLYGEPAAYLGMLAVSADLQSRGLGTALVNEVEHRAKAVYNCRRIVLDVLDCRTQLIDWYLRAGFRHTRQTAHARSFMEKKGEELLVDCSFIVLEKHL